MTVAKIQVMATVNGVGVWRVIAPIDPAYVRRLTDQELAILIKAFPRLVESVIKERKELEPAATVRKKK